MISPLPWKLNEEDPSIIYDAEGEIIAKDYRFLHLDDFESICRLFNNETIRLLEKEYYGKTAK